MSEEKLYAVKNDKGVWLSLDSSHESVWYTNNPTFFKDRICAEDQIIGRKAHVVTLIEEPKKVVISKEQAEVMKEAHDYVWPAKYITDHCDNSNGLEELLMKAYVNGYTVKKDKKYNLILGTDTDGDTNAIAKDNPCDDTLWLDTHTYADDLKLDKSYQFTQEEIDKFNKDFWIKGIDLNDYKVEVEG